MGEHSMSPPPRAAVRMAALLVVTLSGPAFAQAPTGTEVSEPSPIPHTTAGAMVFSVTEKPRPAGSDDGEPTTVASFEWERPRNVQWALISGCGGGGSGAIGNQVSSEFSFGGGGGGGASIDTMLIGP